MKHILAVYGLISLLVLALLSILSYARGPGYVYMLWHGVQLQTNIWVLSFFVILLSLIFQLLWYWGKNLINQQKRKIQQVLDFDQLHTYEKLGVLWVLEGESRQQDYILPVFEQSGLLKHIIQSRIEWKKNHNDVALNILQQSPADAFELAEIQRVEIYLAQAEAEQALTHLEFLHQHQLSPWLSSLQAIYTARINKLWGRFAVQFPWHYLKATHYGHLDDADKINWLLKLLSEFDQASIEDWQLIGERYLNIQEQVSEHCYEIRSLWLKLLARLPEMAQAHSTLSLQLLDERFDQDIFYLWFQQQLLRQNPDYIVIEKEIDNLEHKYPSLPILTFSKWHILMATEREAQARQLLTLYPDNPLMSYLRVKSSLNGDLDLMQQLNIIFESDNKFIQVKI